MERFIQIPSGDLELAATLHYPSTGKGTASEGKSKYPLVVICHGFVGNRIGTDRLFVRAARELAGDGYMVLRFDYGGCGESTGDYGAGGISRMIRETRTMLQYGFGLDCVDSERVTLLGHSLGGAVALLTAALERVVRNLVLWAPVANPFNDIVRIVGQPAYDRAAAEGATAYAGYSLRAGFFDSLAEVHPMEQVRRFSGDVLLVHGTGDNVIPVDYTHLYQKVFWMRHSGQCDKEILPQADHTFSTGNSAQVCMETTRQWLRFAERRRETWSQWTI